MGSTLIEVLAEEEEEVGTGLAASLCSWSSSASISEARCCASGYSSASHPLSCTTMVGYNPTELAGLLKLSTPPSGDVKPNLAIDCFSTCSGFTSARLVRERGGDRDGGGGEELERMERRLGAPRLACAADSRSAWSSVEGLPLPCEACSL